MRGLKKLIIIVIILFKLTTAYALNLDNLRDYFLNENYKACINAGEKILAQSSSNKGLEELYYILGLSYLKDDNYLRASDIFEIILQEYPDNKFKEKAMLGLGDSYFARRDYQKAQNIYQEILKNNSQSKLKPALYYRLSQLGKKTTNNLDQQKYQSKLKNEFPQSPEALSNKELFPTPTIKPDLNTSLPAPKVEEIIISKYNVQVGAFSSLNNAQNLTQKLKTQGYSSYIVEALSANKQIYKVRIGGFSGAQEARNAQKKLQAQGFSSKIIP